MLKNTLTVLRGTVAAQALGFLALPLLSRMFAPEAFGQFQLYQSVLTLLLVVTSMRYEIAILHASNATEIATVLKLCIVLNVVVAAAVALLCWAASAMHLLASTAMLQIKWFIPLGALLAGVLQTLSYLPLRRKLFAIGATARIAQAGGYVCAGVGIGAIAPISGGLIMADLAGRLVSIATFWRSRAELGAVGLLHGAASLTAVARKYANFPFISVPGGLINAAGGVMTPLLMYGAFNISVAGQYGLTERGMMLPVGMIAVAVSQVFSADMASCLREGGSGALSIFRGLVRRMFLIGIVPACLVWIFAPSIFQLVFGPKWLLSGEFARIMAPLLVASVVAGSVNMALLIIGEQRTQLAWEIGRLIVVSGSWLVITHFSIQPRSAVALHVAANVSMNLVYLWLADLMIRRHTLRLAPGSGGGGYP